MEDPLWDPARDEHSTRKTSCAIEGQTWTA